MGFQIKTANDPIDIDPLVVVIYGKPGLGKTTLASTASRPVFIDFDRSLKRFDGTANRITCDSTKDLLAITKDDLAAFDTIVIDTVGKCINTLKAEVIASDRSLMKGGNFAIRGWGVVATQFRDLITKLRALDKEIILVVHCQEKENGDNTVYNYMIEGNAPKGLLDQDSDLIGFLSLRNGERVIDFNPDEFKVGKNCAELEPINFNKKNSSCLADIISRTKSYLNKKNIKAIEYQQRFKQLCSEINACDNIEAINDMLAKVIESKDEALKPVLHAKAKLLWLTFDTAKKQYQEIKEVAEKQPEAEPVQDTHKAS